MNEYQFSEALKDIWKFISRLNKYIDECEPWKLAKEEDKKDRLSTVMYNLVEGLYKIAIVISPFMPQTAQKMIDQLGLIEDVTKIKLKKFKEWGIYPIGNKLKDPEPIFPRIDLEEIEEEEKEEFNSNLKIENPITINDFSKVEMKVVQIEKVSRVENADKLLKFIVNTGTEKRQIVSGIAKWYKEEELVGKKVMAVLNLKPVKLKGEISQGMLLTTVEKKQTKLIFIDENVKLGASVK